MIIPVPFPSIPDCLNHFTLPWLTYTIKATSYRIRNKERRGAWSYHNHFLAEYGLAGLEILLPKLADTKDYLPIKFTLLEEQERVINTGPPEWWGDPTIHDSHKLFLMFNNFNPWHNKLDTNFLVKPKRDFDKIITNLQPILRGEKVYDNSL